MNALQVSLDFGVQAYKRFDIPLGQSIVQFLYTIGFLSVTGRVSGLGLTSRMTEPLEFS
jgi:hypothetical protein